MQRPLILEHRRSKAMLKRGCYARIDTALPKAIQRLLLEGAPGDTCSIYARETGVWVMDVRVAVGGRIKLFY